MTEGFVVFFLGLALFVLSFAIYFMAHYERKVYIRFEERIQYLEEVNAHKRLRHDVTGGIEDVTAILLAELFEEETRAEFRKQRIEKAKSILGDVRNLRYDAEQPSGKR